MTSFYVFLSVRSMQNKKSNRSQSFWILIPKLIEYVCIDHSDEKYSQGHLITPCVK